MTGNPLLIHEKATDIGNVLPSVAELVQDREETLQAYRNLDGEIQQFDYRQVAAQDTYAMPMPVDREGYGTVASTPNFWATGHCDWMNVNEAIGRYLKVSKASRPLRLLDFGCASCRFLRHVAVFGGENFDPWGCDFAVENVNWNKRHLPPSIKTFLNNANPHLPFPDGYFDVITAFSVFTHIDHFEDAWLLELRRITRPGGLLYLTVQNDSMWANSSSDEGYINHLSRANKIEGNPIHVTPEIFDAPMPQDRLVFRMSKSSVYNCNVWHQDEYLQNNWGRYFKIHAIANQGHNNRQSPVMMSPR
jgi:SAM-dependent methyltransferase